MNWLLLHVLETQLFVFWYLQGDCEDDDGVKDRCVAGAINNYTSQLLAYKNNAISARSKECE